MFSCWIAADADRCPKFSKCYPCSQMGRGINVRIDVQKVRIQTKNNKHNDNHPRIYKYSRIGNGQLTNKSGSVRNGIFYEYFGWNVLLHFFSLSTQ